MQSSQDGPPPSKRPSLLGADQPESSDKQPLLAGIDGRAKQQAGAAKAPRRKAAWIAALLVLAAGGGAAAWMSNSGEEPVLAVAAPVTPAKAPAVAVPAAASVEAPDVSTAAILHDTSADEDKAAAALARKPATKADTEALTALLEDKPAQKADKPRDDKAAASRADKRAAEHAREKRLAARERLARKEAEKHPLARTVVAKKAAAPEVDSDVALLAALVAHSKAAQGTRTSAPAPAAGPDARKLRQCKALDSVAEAEACRARLCSGSAKTSAACKPASVAQADAS